MDFGLFAFRKMQVQHAAQMGAQYAAANGYSSANISSVVTDDNLTTFAINASPAPSQFCACPSSTGSTSATCSSTCGNGSAAGTYVTVSASATYNMLIVPVHGKLFPSSFQPLTRLLRLRRCASNETEAIPQRYSRRSVCRICNRAVSLPGHHLWPYPSWIRWYWPKFGCNKASKWPPVARPSTTPRRTAIPMQTPKVGR